MKTFKRSTRTWVLVTVVVVVVATVVASVVGVRYERIQQVEERAQVLIAEAGLRSFESALLSYRLDTGVFPSTDQGLRALLTPPKDVAASWAGPYVSDVPVDPWETPYQYAYPADASNGFAIYSLGADSAPGGEGFNADLRIFSEHKLEEPEPDVPQKPTGAPFHIQTVPENARVRIMDIAEAYRDGMAPAPGEYRVEVSAPGFRTKAEDVWHGMSATTYQVVLDPIPPEEAPLFVKTVPRHARVRIMDVAQAYQDGMALAPGEYRVEVSAVGFHTKTEVVRHGTSATAHRVVLDQVVPEEAPFFVETTPSDALVSVMGADGTAFWESRPMERPGMRLPPGDYWIGARAEGYDAQEERRVSHGTSPTTHRIVLTLSSTVFEGAPSADAPIFVETVPPDALVKVVHGDGAVVWQSRQMRRPGVETPPGSYRIVVSAQGFREKTVVVSHGSSRSATRVALVAIPPPPDPPAQRATPPDTRKPPADIQEYRLMERVEPNFPRTAARQDVGGHVVLSFTIAPTGRVEDVVVVEAKPRGLFDRAARAALNRWRYTPRIVDGVPVEVRGVQARFDFQLED